MRLEELRRAGTRARKKYRKELGGLMAEGKTLINGHGELIAVTTTETDAKYLAGLVGDLGYREGEIGMLKRVISSQSETIHILTSKLGDDT